MRLSRRFAGSLVACAALDLLGCGARSSPAVGFASAELGSIAARSSATPASSGAPDDDAVELEEPGAEVLWRFHAGAPLVGPPVVASSGRVYVGTAEGYVHALGPDGSYLWSYTMPGPIQGGLAVDQRGVLYGGVRGQRVVAVSADGRLLWVLKISADPASELVLAPSGLLYFAGRDRSVYGVSPRGGVRVRIPIPEGIAAGPVVDGRGRAVVGAPPNRLYFAESALKKQRFVLSGSVTQAPLVAGGQGFYVVAGERLMALRDDGVWLWEREGVRAAALGPRGPVALSLDGVLSFLSHDGSERASVATGAGLSPPMLVDAAERVYSAVGRGGLATATPQGKVFRLRVAQDLVTSLVADGSRARVIVAAGGGTVLAFSSAGE
jgi:outer membrane protein assembly factor BamB